MKFIPIILGILLGLIFIMASAVVLFHLVKMPPIPAGPVSDFFGAFGPTGYLTFVKVMEMTGGILVMIPLTRCLGLLILGPIIVNILAFHFFIQQDGLKDPTVIAVSLLALSLLFFERRAFFGLIVRPKTV
jgi:putative oxidoreductase